jgi:hypothetical protein
MIGDVKRRRVIVVVGGCLVAAVLIFTVWPGEREPEYQGKKLSEWLDDYWPGRGHLISIPPDWERNRLEAEVAVRRIGTNGLPWMVEWLRNADRPSLTDRVRRIYGMLPEGIRSQSVDEYLDKRGRLGCGYAGYNGVVILAMDGHVDAGAALPEVRRIAQDTNSPYASYMAGLAVGVIMSFEYSAEEEANTARGTVKRRERDTNR